MADPLDINNESALDGFLKWLSRPGYAVRDALHGNLGGSVRQAVDFFLDPIDAVLPSDVLPELSRRGQDFTEASDLFGGMDPGLGKTTVDILGGIATDPMTYVGVGPLAKAALTPLTSGAKLGAQLAQKTPAGAAAIDAITGAADTAGRKLREVAGAQRVAEWARPILERAKATGAVSSAANEAFLKDMLAGLQPDDQARLVEAINNVTRDGGLDKAGGLARQVLPDSGASAPYDATASVENMLSAPRPGAPLKAEDAFMQVRPEGTASGTVDPLSKRLGAAGVAVSPDELAAKDGDALFANDAASRLRSQAFPATTVDPRYASGIDAVNAALGIGPKPRTVAEGRIIAAPPAADSVGDAAAQAAANAALPDAVGVRRDPLSAMLGATDVVPPRARGAELAGAIDAVNMQQGGAIPGLTKTAAADLPELRDSFSYITDQADTLRKRLDALGVEGPQRARIDGVIDKWVNYTANQFRENVERNVFERPQGRDLLRESPLYAQRQFSGFEDATTAALRAAAGGTAAAAKGRSLRSGQDVASFLNENPELSMSTNLAELASQRAGQQGQMLQQASIASDLVERTARTAEDKLSKASRDVENWTGISSSSERYKLAGLTEAERAAYEARGAPLFRSGDQSSDLAKAARLVLDEMRAADPETAQVLEAAYHGIGPRGALMDVLAKTNRIFKPFATAGAFIPRINFTVRNVTTGGMWQVLSNPEARGVFPQYAKQAAGTIMGAVDDGIERLTGHRLASTELQDIRQALVGSGGRVADAIDRVKDPLNREALRLGVITNGFINTEGLAKEIARTGWSKRWRDIRDWPAEIAKGSEERMRLGTFKALVQRGKTPDEAARIVKDTFFDYDISSAGNRAARDVIPFFQFTAKAIPQQMRLLMERGAFPSAVRSGVQHLYAQGNGAVLPPQLLDQAVVPLGRDADGNPTYLTSFGLPYEALSMVPNLTGNLADIGPEIRQNLVAASNPVIKSAYSLVSGSDPYFGTPFGSFDRTPYLAQQLGADEEGDAARVWNILAGSGLIQPLAAPVSTLSAAMDPRRSAGEAALNTLTGIRIKSVDEQQALRQLLEEALKRNPDVQRYETLYQQDPDAETQQLLDELRAIKQQIKKRRQAEVQ